MLHQDRKGEVILRFTASDYSFGMLKFSLVISCHSMLQLQTNDCFH